MPLWVHGLDLNYPCLSLCLSSSPLHPFSSPIPKRSKLDNVGRELSAQIGKIVPPLLPPPFFFDCKYLFAELNSKPPIAENSITMEELCNLHADRRDTYAKAPKQPNPNKKAPIDPNKLEVGIISFFLLSLFFFVFSFLLSSMI